MKKEERKLKNPKVKAERPRFSQGSLIIEKARTGHRRRNLDLESYEPIKILDEGFEIKAYKFKGDSSMDFRPVIKKMKELKGKADLIIEILTFLQTQKRNDEPSWELRTIFSYLALTITAGSPRIREYYPSGQ